MAKQTTSLAVLGMSCSHCEASIKKAVGSLDGVDTVSVDLGGKKVTVEFDTDKVKIKQIEDAIEDQGYDVA